MQKISIDRNELESWLISISECEVPLSIDFGPSYELARSRRLSAIKEMRKYLSKQRKNLRGGMVCHRCGADRTTEPCALESDSQNSCDFTIKVI